MRHLLRDDDLTAAEQADILALAASYKSAPYDAKPLAGPKSVALIFDKPTLRTQTSFAAGIAELGGNPLLVDGNLAGIGVRESIADVARVLGRQVSAIVWRTGDQSRVDEMAATAGVPVVNALTDQFHPCQLLADLLTISERKGAPAGQTLAFLGDGGCNMGHSTLLAGALAPIMADHVEWRFVYVVMAIAMAIPVAANLLAQEPVVPEKLSARWRDVMRDGVLASTR